MLSHTNMQPDIWVCHTQPLEWARQYRMSTTTSVVDIIAFLGLFVIKHFKNLVCVYLHVEGLSWDSDGRPTLTNMPMQLGSSLPCHSTWRWTHTPISGIIIVMPLSKSFEVRHDLVWHKNVGAYRWHTLTLDTTLLVNCNVMPSVLNYQHTSAEINTNFFYVLESCFITLLSKVHLWSWRIDKGTIP